MPNYGPSCDIKNVLSCVTYTDNNTCEVTTKENIQRLAQDGGGGLAQNNYCFPSSQECENNKTYFQCQNKILNIKSMMT
jgi:hypothetical protein